MVLVRVRFVLFLETFLHFHHTNPTSPVGLRTHGTFIQGFLVLVYMFGRFAFIFHGAGARRLVLVETLLLLKPALARIRSLSSEAVESLCTR